jgi:hypothetical protein
VKLEIGEEYTTHKSGVVGWIMEIVPNRTGSFRLRLRTETNEVRWTTYVPPVAMEYPCGDFLDEGLMK